MINRVVLVGRLTRDPELRKTQSGTSVCSFTMAVGRRVSTQGQPDADFINCVAFKKSGEFADKYFRQGLRILASGRLQTGSYVNKDGQKVYTTDVIVEEQEFADGKNQASGENSSTAGGKPVGDGFMQIPDGVEDAGLPFN